MYGYSSSSAPGSLMLMGEHAVVYGRPALVCAVEPRITVTIQARFDQALTITSAHFPFYQTTILNFIIEPPYAFILSALTHFQNYFETGFDVRISSGLAHQQGWGTSAAVTVATLHVLARHLKIPLPPFELLKAAREAILRVQGRGSASDAAASIYGGVIAYDPVVLHVEKIINDLPLSWVYSGSKVPTAEVIARVAALRDCEPHRIEALFDGMHDLVEAAKNLLLRQDWIGLGKIMNTHQGLQEKLGVSTPLLELLIQELRQSNRIYGAKISGSGLGDAVIGLGSLSEHDFPRSMEQKQQGIFSKLIDVAKEGVRDES